MSEIPHNKISDASDDYFLLKIEIEQLFER